MRKLDASIVIEPFGDAGARLLIKTRTGESFCVDVPGGEVPGHRDSLNAIMSAPAAEVFAPKPPEAAADGGKGKSAKPKRSKK